MAQAVIRAKTDLDASGFERGINAMRAGASRIKGFVAGAFSVGAIAGTAKATISAGGDIADMADNIGVTTDELQALQYGFRNAGAEAGALEQILFKIKQQSADAALEGEASSAAKAFGALGISLKEVSDLTQAEKLERIARAFVDSGESAAVYSNVLDLLGKQGGKTENALRALGREGVGGFLMDALAAGNVASEAAIRAADKADDAIQNTIKAAQRAAIEVTGAFAEDPQKQGIGGTKKSDIDAQIRADRQKKLDDEDAAKMRLDTAAKLERHNAKMMDDSERMVFLMGELRRLNETVLAFDASSLEMAKLEAAKADAQIELDELKRQVEDAEKATQDSPRFDELRRIGGNLFSRATSQDPRVEQKKLVSTADKQLAELQTISRKMTSGATF